MSYEKKIREFMTTQPIAVGPDASLEEAFELMGECNLRHLPVVRDTRILGVISERDIAHAWNSPQTDKKTVAAAMTAHPYIVDPEAPMSRVLEVMASNKFGCALVRDTGGNLVGIFTTTDAIQLLAQVFRAPAITPEQNVPAAAARGEDDDDFTTESEYYKD
jgi:acetoin utilization protein AcuB